MTQLGLFAPSLNEFLELPSHGQNEQRNDSGADGNAERAQSDGYANRRGHPKTGRGG